MKDKTFFEISRRRTFAIVSHPDAGKTTVTEKILLISKAIHTVDTIKSKRTGRNFRSDWMEIERKRGISVTTSVMQFMYKDCLINLLDTPGHSDFSEDTYRILTAVDCCLMIIDAAKGVEERTKKLIDVTRLHKTPIITFINKLDRNSISPMSLIDQLEDLLNISCAPLNWPIECGNLFKGIFDFQTNKIDLYKKKIPNHCNYTNINHINFQTKNYQLLYKQLGYDFTSDLFKELDLIHEIYASFNHKLFLSGKLTPVLFGVALKGFGVDHVLNFLTNWGPYPNSRISDLRLVYPEEKFFSGFVFKIQANMDLKHRDRIAFIRIVSGKYYMGIKLKNVRTKKHVIISNAFIFLGKDRKFVKRAYPGDIIGFHSFDTIKIGDTFTEGEEINFLGIPSFSPEFFKMICLRDPMKQKHLLKGLLQLSEEGAIQIFRPIVNNHLVLGAIGLLQFDVVSDRLKHEYKVLTYYVKVNIKVSRWVSSCDLRKLNEFKKNNESYMAYDSRNRLVYMAPSKINLNLTSSRYPDLIFSDICEH